MSAQIHEILIYEGENRSMASCPPLPKFHSRIKDLSEQDTTSDDGGGLLLSTGCWRRYVGTWEINDDRLYLVHLKGRYRLEGDGPLFADWFTGVLRLPQGKLLQYVHMGFDSIYEEDVNIEIESGIVTRIATINNHDKFERQKIQQSLDRDKHSLNPFLAPWYRLVRFWRRFNNA